MHKKLIILLPITVVGGLLGLDGLLINPIYAGSFFDDSKKESFFNPAANKAIIRELLYYLKFHLVSKGKGQKAEEISELIELFD